MLKKTTRDIASMVCKTSENGFTFIGVLLALSTLVLCLPLLSDLLKTNGHSTKYTELSIQQFFYFLMDDSIGALHYSVKSDSVSLHLPGGSIAKISQYNDQVRRQVNGVGHEIYLRNIKKIQFSPLPYGYHVSVVSDKGDIHEKIIPFPINE